MAHLDEPPPIQEGLAKLEHLIEIGDEELKAKREEIRNDDSKTDEEKADELSQLGHKAQAWEDEEHPGMNRSAERWLRRSHLGIPARREKALKTCNARLLVYWASFSVPGRPKTTQPQRHMGTIGWLYPAMG